ncbi:hypothetical protein [Pseudomonas sp.]|uniref:hypothetical protein n=1 Tax=Pseudomonas sp. TaxID=306 RepID=UPI002908CAFE|nr:hypothetical protein [Pseudomonas sp.]MDU4254483.1 hypothetical protein [Pseudomonas sp.]
MSDENMKAVEQAATNLNRMRGAMASNELSGLAISSDSGKAALAALLAESVDGNFRADMARETIKKVMKLG